MINDNKNVVTSWQSIQVTDTSVSYSFSIVTGILLACLVTFAVIVGGY